MASGLAEMAQRRNSAKRSDPANYRTPPLPLGPEAAGRSVCAFPSVFLETAEAFHTSALALIGAGTVWHKHCAAWH